MFMRDYIIASDNFIAYRPAFALYTIIAGYPWFLDWGRDALIAFEGITLIPRRFQVAKRSNVNICKRYKIWISSKWIFRI